MSVRALVVVVLFACGCDAIWPAIASAQNRSGGWFAAGGGFGSAGISCDDCDDAERDSGPDGFLRGGWALNPPVLLGVELHLWSKEVADEEDFSATVNLYNVAATITFYPSASSGFFVKGGAGLGFVDMDNSFAGTTVTTELGKGFGLIAGAGYDIPLGRRVALTPAVDYLYGQPGDLMVFGTPVFGHFKYNVITATVGITIQ